MTVVAIVTSLALAVEEAPLPAPTAVSARQLYGQAVEISWRAPHDRAITSYRVIDSLADPPVEVPYGITTLVLNGLTYGVNLRFGVESEAASRVSAPTWSVPIDLAIRALVVAQPSPSPAPSPKPSPALIAVRSSPPPAAPPTAPRPTTWVLKVPVIGQTYNLSCEAASLQMALAYYGTSASQSTLLSLMKPDDTTPQMSNGRVVHWSDPYVNFVGNPSGHEYNYTGYGVYYPVVARVTSDEGRRVVWQGTALSWSQLTRFIQAGEPVVMWIAYNGSSYSESGPLYYYQAWDGRQVPYAPGYEHAVTVAGISGSSVLINNPRWGFQQWLDKTTFLNAVAPFGNMAVVVG